MGLWAFIIVALFFQESATMTAAILQAKSNGLNPYIVHLIYIIDTLVTISVGYLIGVWTSKKFKNTKFWKLSNKWVEKVERLVGKKGLTFALILLGIVNYPWLNSFFASWLKIPFKKMIILIFIGDAIWYILDWAIVLGFLKVIPNPHLTLPILIVVVLIASLFSKKIFDKVLR